jgi:hypothetical protein
LICFKKQKSPPLSWRAFLISEMLTLLLPSCDGGALELLKQLPSYDDALELPS